MVKLIWITPEAEKFISYIARVSNPSNQDNPEYEKLLRYLIRNKHWSPFEMASMCVEINTSRRIAPQILRHRSFSFQEFSTRYAAVDGFVDVEPNKQAETNRQSSTDNLDPDQIIWFKHEKLWLEQQAMSIYKEGLNIGIAKEDMAFLLPMSTKTRIYMSGTIRSWIHYIELRTDPHTQHQHQEIAFACKEIFCKELPTVAKALEWM